MVAFEFTININCYQGGRHNQVVNKKDESIWDNRIIEINENLNRLKQKTYYGLLNSDEGIQRRQKRCFDTEPVFGNIK